MLSDEPVGLTYEAMKKAMDAWNEHEEVPERDSIEGLKRRIVFCAGPVIAIIRAYGYVFCVDEGFLNVYRQSKRIEYTGMMREFTDEQLKEQGVL